MRLKRLAAPLFFLLAACSLEADPYRPGERGEVTAIAGALTLTLAPAPDAAAAPDAERDEPAGTLDVRLAELDAPDPARSRAALEMLAEGKTVRLSYAGQTRDRYRRALAQVHVIAADGRETWLQARLVETGAARVLSHADNRAAARDLLVLEGHARAAGRGLWSDPAHAVRDTHPDALAQDIGSVQLVEGRVIEATQLRSGRIYLNFGADYRTDFTVMIEAEDASAFDAAGLTPAALETRRIRVRGWIEDENGPMIRIDHPERIELLAD
ncbi:MAG: thermonuclease family protein [Pseudomonadota bacterium]|nr:thermonuclease family protein [Pseudomonadota bacterium]